jgi:hypothetical protein
MADINYTLPKEPSRSVNVRRKLKSGVRFIRTVCLVLPQIKRTIYLQKSQVKSCKINGESILCAGFRKTKYV